MQWWIVDDDPKKSHDIMIVSVKYKIMSKSRNYCTITQSFTCFMAIRALLLISDDTPFNTIQNDNNWVQVLS